MSNFRFKKQAIYKLNGKGSGNISNTNMTDEKAVAFLKGNPARIKMFSQFPENWKEMLEGAEAVINESSTQGEDKLTDQVEDSLEDVKKPCTPCERKRLEKMKMNELKETYPDIKVPFGMKKIELVEAIIAAKYL